MLIIDIHGHQTLVPKAHLEFREKQMARLADPSLPRPDLPEYTDDELRDICQLPQQIIGTKVAPLEDAIAELERCVNDLGFIGCNLNPDPSGGHFSAPPLTDKYWYPLYETTHL